MDELTRVKDEVLMSVSKHALAAYPEECCGFLYGYEKEGHGQVWISRPANNGYVHLRTRRYRISPADYMEGERFADESGLNLSGVYHSHPDHPAVPSQYDEEWAVPGLVYLIVGIEGAKVTDFRWWELSADGSKLVEVRSLKERVEEEHP
ncbi:MAG: M67 family metallopeptidase [Candidatus Neomarinimicrobiota bacterium]